MDYKYRAAILCSTAHENAVERMWVWKKSLVPLDISMSGFGEGGV